MKNKIHLELRKAEIEWFLTFPDVPDEDIRSLKSELAVILFNLEEMKGGTRKW